jgi:hypothetical protein
MILSNSLLTFQWKTIFQAGFWEPRETAANRDLSFFIIPFLFSAFTAWFWHHWVFWSAKSPGRMPRHTFACYLYWRCLVTIYWLSAYNVISTCSAFVYRVLIHLISPTFRDLRHLIAEIYCIFIKKVFSSILINCRFLVLLSCRILFFWAADSQPSWLDFIRSASGNPASDPCQCPLWGLTPPAVRSSDQNAAGTEIGIVVERRPINLVEYPWKIGACWRTNFPLLASMLDD